jgi:hypothetical protein
VAGAPSEIDRPPWTEELTLVPHSAYLPAAAADLRRPFTNPFAGWRQAAREQHLADVFALLDGSARSVDLFEDATRGQTARMEFELGELAAFAA